MRAFDSYRDNFQQVFDRSDVNRIWGTNSYFHVLLSLVFFFFPFTILEVGLSSSLEGVIIETPNTD